MRQQLSKDGVDVRPPFAKKTFEPGLLHALFVESADHLGGNPTIETARFAVLRYDCAGGHEGASADPDTGQDQRPRAYPTAVLDRDRTRGPPSKSLRAWPKFMRGREDHDVGSNADASPDRHPFDVLNVNVVIHIAARANADVRRVEIATEANMQ